MGEDQAMWFGGVGHGEAGPGAAGRGLAGLGLAGQGLQWSKGQLDVYTRV